LLARIVKSSGPARSELLTPNSPSLRPLRNVLRARQRQVRVSEVELLDDIVLVALVIDREAIEERDLDAGILEQVDANTV
jgi:hypothetical protein